MAEHSPARVGASKASYYLAAASLVPPLFLAVLFFSGQKLSEGGLLISVAGSVAFGVLAGVIGVAAQLAERAQENRAEMLNDLLRREILVAQGESKALLAEFERRRSERPVQLE